MAGFFDNLMSLKYAQVQQALRGVADSLAGLLPGVFRSFTPGRLPRRGLSLEQVSALIAPWAEQSAELAEARFESTMQALDARGRLEFAEHVETLAKQVQAQIEELQQHDNRHAWGNTFEDRMAYLQARMQSGRPTPASRLIAQQERVLRALVQLATATRQWQQPEPSLEPRASTTP